MNTAECTKMLVNLQIRLLKQLRNKIDGHYYDKPIEDFTEREKGYETGLSAVMSDVNTMIDELEKS